MGYEERDDVPMSVQPWPKRARIGTILGGRARGLVWASIALSVLNMLMPWRTVDAPMVLLLASLGLAILGGLIALARRPTAASLITVAMAAGAYVLNAFAFPVIVPSPDRPQRSKSLNNIRQLAVAAQMYAQDYGETYPGWVNDGSDAAPRYAHNTWDEQIAGRLKDQRAFGSEAAGIRSPSQPGPNRNRVLMYGLNGALLAGRGNGHVAFSEVGPNSPPAPLGPSSVSNPAGTILFAELATDEPMDGLYGQTIPPEERPRSGGADWAGTKAYEKAHPGWIDIDPRAFCELTTPRSNNYQEPYRDAVGRGVGRNLYGRKRFLAAVEGGGGCYAYCDGHVQFMQLAKTVGLGQIVNGKRVTADNCWEPWNKFNMWNPNQ